MESKQINKQNESDASLTASKQEAGAPLNALNTEDSVSNGTNSEGVGQTALKSDNTTASAENETQQISADDQTSKNTDGSRTQVRKGAAARKRFKLLRAQGHSIEIARILSEENSSGDIENSAETVDSKDKINREIVVKRFNLLRKKGYSIEDSRKLALSNKLSLKDINNIPPFGKLSAKAGEGDVKNTIIRVVVKASKAGIMLTKNEQRLVQEEILKKIVEFKGTGVKPKFLGQAYKAGWMVLNCADQSTLIWLRKIINQVKPWPGAHFKIVQEDANTAAIESHVVVASFPNSLDDTSKAILGFVEAQNEGFVTKHWKVLNRLIEGTSVQLKLKLDKASIEQLKGLGFRVCYKFGKVHLKPNENQPRGNIPPLRSNIPPLRNFNNSGSQNRFGPLNRSGSRNGSGPLNRSGPQNRFGQPNRTGGPGPIRNNNRQVARSNVGPPNRGPVNRLSGGTDMSSRRSENVNRGAAGGGRGSLNGNNIINGPSITNQLNEFASNIDKLRSLMQQQQPPSNNNNNNNNYEMFSRRGDNNNPSTRNNDNYDDSSYGNSNQNFGNSNFRSPGYQNNVGLRDTPSTYGGNSGYANNSGSSSNNFRTPSNFGNSSNYGNPSSNFGNSNFDSSPSFGLSRANVWDNNKYESTGKSSLSNNTSGGGWYRR